MKIAEVKELLAGTPTAEQLAELRLDARAGVQKLLAAYTKRLAAEAAERDRLLHFQDLERRYWEQGLNQVAGTDEAGRGPLAGPLVTAAVILPHGIWLPGLNDSKKVRPARREELYDEILDQAVAVTVTILGPREIDALNIYQAAKWSMTNCLNHLSTPPQAALTDAMPLTLASGIPVEDLVKGDSKSAAIAAASIIAKVTRDRLLVELDAQYPQYGFAAHKGYGVSTHVEAILRDGPCPWHRGSYEPIKTHFPQHQGISEEKTLVLK